MRLLKKIKASIARGLRSWHPFPLDEIRSVAKKEPSQPESITEKQGLNGIIVLQKGTKS